MRKVIALCVFCLAVAAWAAPAEDGDHTPVDEILANRRLLIPYVKCALDQGKCTSRGKTLKANIKDALATDCGKCTPDEKKDAELIFKHMINKENDYWNQLAAKYDPENKYKEKYEKRYKQ